MIFKIKLTKPLRQCSSLKSVVAKHGLQLQPLFPGANQRTTLLWRIESPTPEQMVAVNACADVYESVRAEGTPEPVHEGHEGPAIKIGGQARRK